MSEQTSILKWRSPSEKPKLFSVALGVIARTGCKTPSCMAICYPRQGWAFEDGTPLGRQYTLLAWAEYPDVTGITFESAAASPSSDLAGAGREVGDE